MKTSRLILGVVGLAISGIFCNGASAITIGFGGLAGVNGAPFTSYTESGFTVTATTGSWLQGQLFGNPIPSIFSGPLFGSPANDSIRVTEGGQPFSFRSVDLAANNGDVVYTLTGTLNGGPVFNVTGTEPGHLSPFLFVTVPSGASTDLIDDLVIAVHITGTSTNIDNIVVSTTEPMTLGMLAAALVLLALQRRLCNGRLT